jgi:predicted metal-dependent HD superfamily phosphohydrolase
VERRAALIQRFGRLARRLGARTDPAELAAALVAAWAEPGRAYHGIAHLADCLARLDEAPDEGHHDTVEAALWFHDAVYDSRASDNEARSAGWAREGLTGIGVPSPVAEEVARLVLVTRHEAPATDPAAALVSDVDLSILGRAPETYDEFERRIREEFAWVPEPAFRMERARVLARFLRREPLYLTPAFRERYERKARANLDRTVARLVRS